MKGRWVTLRGAELAIILFAFNRLELHRTARATVNGRILLKRNRQVIVG